MSRTIDAFANLIAPVGADSFFADKWEKEPVHISRSDPGFYDCLVTAADVENAISSGGLRYPAIQLAKGGAFFAPEAFTRSLRSGDDVFSGVPIVERIEAAYRAGASISLPGFHRAWQPLAALAAIVESELDHPVHANVYVTPGKATGFSPHYDTHEVFVLQIAGSKLWQIASPSIALPHRSQPFRPQDASDFKPTLEFRMRPGDLLYLPRGYVHTTTTDDKASIHVTLGITVFTWADLIAEWAQLSRNSPDFRSALPPGFAGRASLRPEIARTLSEMLSRLQAQTDNEVLLEDFSRRVRSAQRTAHGAFRIDASAEKSDR